MLSQTEIDYYKGNHTIDITLHRLQPKTKCHDMPLNTFCIEKRLKRKFKIVMFSLFYVMYQFLFEKICKVLFDIHAK
jgi:hypothetical protein